MSNNNIMKIITGGFAESARAVREINRENMAAVKADSKALFDEAKTPDPGMVKFKEAKGLGSKVKVVAECIKEGAAEASENERERRAEIQSFDAYRALLDESRESVKSYAWYTGYTPFSRTPSLGAF